MGLVPTNHRLFVVSAKFGRAPAPTASNPRPRTVVLPGRFELLMIERTSGTR